MKLLEVVHPKAIVCELHARDRNGVIRELVQSLADCGAVESELADSISRSIVARERSRGTTGIGKGIALPHAKVDGVRKLVAAVGRSSNGVDFESLDSQPVFGVFLLISPADQPEQHLQAMDVIFRVLQQERFRKFLRQADQVEKVLDLLKEADEKPLST